VSRDYLTAQLSLQAAARGHAEFAEGVPQLRFHGRLGDEQVLGDLPVRQPASGQRCGRQPAAAPGDLAAGLLRMAEFFNTPAEVRG
jgi:hypothetical protein